jgi:hypothetical protein
MEKINISVQGCLFLFLQTPYQTPPPVQKGKAFLIIAIRLKDIVCNEKGGGLGRRKMFAIGLGPMAINVLLYFSFVVEQCISVSARKAKFIDYVPMNRQKSGNGSRRFPF